MDAPENKKTKQPLSGMAYHFTRLHITQGYMGNGESTNGLIMIVRGTLFVKVYTVEAHLTDTLISEKLYLWAPSQNAVFLHSHTNYVFLHSCKWPAAVTDIFFAS